MLNDPRATEAEGDVEGEGEGEGAGAGAGAQGAPQTNYIQVTPQEKEAIERVGGPGGEMIPPFQFTVMEKMSKRVQKAFYDVDLTLNMVFSPIPKC